MLHEEVLLLYSHCHARRLSSRLSSLDGDDGDDRASPLNEALKRKSPGHRPGPSQMHYTARCLVN